MTFEVVRNWLMAAVAVFLGAVVMGVPVHADERAGSQGTDTSLPLTDSAVTVSGRGEFADLRITLNQTRNLTNQAISVTWEGGEPTRAGPGRFAANYVQVFQCWGDDDGVVAENPGPPPEQCVQGAAAGTFGGVGDGLYPAGFALSRVISRTTWDNYDPAVGAVDPRTTNVWLPFVAVDGTTVPIQVDSTFQPTVQGGNFWLNPYFGIVTTNELAGGATGPDGRGAELMQVLTGVQSTGLGCGQRVQLVEGGDRKVPQCWIVVVPRGLPSTENAGTPFAAGGDQNGVATSPVAPTAWANRIAVPIEFNPVDTPCSLQNEERRVVGTELFFPAIASWQPTLCSVDGLPPYSYAPISDDVARRQLTSSTLGGAGMAVVSRPLAADVVDPENPPVYAPLAGVGLVIGFNVERYPSPTGPDEIQRLAGVRVANLNLTPRLVAKLLTQSYQEQVNIVAPPDYDWDGDNPPHLGQDPDFLRFNPEFELLLIANARSFSGLSLPAGNSDAATQVWEWVMADPEAKAWLDGRPDEWGMRVNPVYSTSAEVNTSGFAFGDPLPAAFPKGDPYCYQAPARGPSSPVPPPLCGTDWMPYARGFSDAAFVARVASDGARIVENPFAQAPSEVWARELPQFVGRRAMLAFTDSASAAQYGLQTASLSRAGDNAPDRTFVQPDAEGLERGLDAMQPRSDLGFREPSTAAAPGAYPLTTLVYGAITPLALEQDARDDYAALIEYAAGPGQVQGLELGQLPRGYVPLTDELTEQAELAAFIVRFLVVLDEPPPVPVDPVVPPVVDPTPPPVVQPPPPFAASPPPLAAPSPSRSTPRAPSASASSGEVASTTIEPTPETSVAEVAEESPSPETTEAADPLEPSAPSSTPGQAVGRVRYAVAGVGIMSLASLLGALEISKRPRRRPPGLSPAGGAAG